MGGGGGTRVIQATPDTVYKPITPQRTAAPSVPEDASIATFTTGAKRTITGMSKQGASGLVIPLGG